ncbi:helix-turn-helix transcriptional regulator [Streptomyces sp. NPDC026673]|uniref:helix-turn-helix transcriptional regulator n=1 Tax=Streptomyces sp. NPDC026673 TaxID=3155724 RepID=UPI0033E752B0
MYDRTALHRAAHAAGIENSHQLAQAAGVSVPTAWRVWTGRTAPRFPIAARIAAAVNITVADVYGTAAA